MFIEASIHQGGYAIPCLHNIEICFRICKKASLDHILGAFQFDSNSHPLTICKINLTIFSTLPVYYWTSAFTQSFPTKRSLCICHLLLHATCTLFLSLLITPTDISSKPLCSTNKSTNINSRNTSTGKQDGPRAKFHVA